MHKVIFLCTGNSCRSQMAEGFARLLGKGIVEPYSAGLTPSRVNPKAIQVMGEIGIDISGQSSKGINDDLLRGMDTVITLCGYAAELCPLTPPGIKRIHWAIDDPVAATGTEDEIMKEFRKARDEIKKDIQNYLQKEIAHSRGCLRYSETYTETAGP
jgi:arsenate reductase